MPNFDAGPYAAYVWPAYGLTVLVIAWLVGGTLVRARRWRRRAEQAPARGKGREAGS